MASAIEASVSGQLQDLVAARLRWGMVRKGRVDVANDETSCRFYRVNFVEAVTVRQAAVLPAETVSIGDDCSS